MLPSRRCMGCAHWYRGLKEAEVVFFLSVNQNLSARNTMSSDRVACRSLLRASFKLPVLFQVALSAFHIVTDLVHKGSNHRPGFTLHVSGLHHQQLLPLTPKSLQIFSSEQHRLVMIPCTTLHLQDIVRVLKRGKHPDDFNL